MKMNKPLRKRKIVRSLSTGVLLLSAFSMFNTGFSSWVIVSELDDKSEMINLTMGTGSVIDSRTLITFQTGGTTSIPNISPIGFIVNEAIYYSFDITIPFSLKIADGLDYYLEGGDNFKLIISLFNLGEFAILNQTFMSSPPVTYTVAPLSNSSSNPITSSIIGGLVVSTINYSNTDLLTQDELAFEITYHFVFSPTNFETNVYNYFNTENAIAFSMRIDIEV